MGISRGWVTNIEQCGEQRRYICEKGTEDRVVDYLEFDQEKYLFYGLLVLFLVPALFAYWQADYDARVGEEVPENKIEVPVLI